MAKNYNKQFAKKVSKPAPKVDFKNTPIQKKDEKRLWLLVTALVATAIVYFPALFNNFTLNWDDGGYINEYAAVHSINAKNLKEIFTAYYKGNYHPLTTFFYALEWSLVGESPFLFHLNNIIIHLINVFLVFKLIEIFSKRYEIAFVTAILFGIHPMHVESVAWISERKDVLYTFFFLSSMLCYYYYFFKNKVRDVKFIVFAWILFGLSLLSKSAAAVLPVVLLLMDYLYKRKITLGLFLEKLPFFALSFIFGIMAIHSQKEVGALQDVDPLFTFFERLFIVSYSIMIYIVKLFVPVHLAAMYPYPQKVANALPWEFYAAPIFVLALGIFWFLVRKMGRIVNFGIMFFIVTIALVLQILPVGGAILSERYTYVPYIGLFMIIGYFYTLAADNKDNYFYKFKKVLIAVFIGFVLFFTYGTFDRIKVWKDGETLFTDLIEKYPTLSFAYNNRGYLFYRYKKDYNRALLDYNKSIELDPGFHRAFSNRGVLYYNTGKPELALADFSSALKYNAVNTDALIGRANTYSTLKKFAESIPDYDKYLTLMPEDSKAWMWLGTAKTNVGKYDEAISVINKSLTMNPKDSESYYWLGIAFSKKNDNQNAIVNFNKAIELNPEKAEYYSWRGLTNYALKKYEEGVADYTKAITMNPNDPAVFVNRSIAYNEMKMYKEAWEDINTAGKMKFPLDKNFFMKLQAKVGAR